MSSNPRPLIRLHCPQCLATLEVDAHHAGQRVPCPTCRFSLAVPTASAAGANLFEDLFESPAPTPPVGDGDEAALDPAGLHLDETELVEPAAIDDDPLIPTAGKPETSAQPPLPRSSPHTPAPAPGKPTNSPSPATTRTGHNNPNRPSEIPTATPPASRGSRSPQAGGPVGASPAGTNDRSGEAVNPLENGFDFDPSILEASEDWAAGINQGPGSGDGDLLFAEDAAGTAAQIARPDPLVPDTRDDSESGSGTVRPAKPAAKPAVPRPAAKTDAASAAALPNRPTSTPANPLIVDLPKTGDGFDLVDDLQLAPLEERAPAGTVDPDRNPLAVDPSAPIRIDGIESASEGVEGTISLRCRVCDSGLQAPAGMLGKQVACPDCGSMVEVVASRKPKSMLPEWAKPRENWEEIQAREDADKYRLAGNMKLEPTLGPRDEQGGLPSERPARMKPVAAPAPILNEEGEDILAGAKATRRVEESVIKSSPFVGGRIAAENQTKRRLRQAAPPNEKKQAVRALESPDPAAEPETPLTRATSGDAPPTANRKAAASRPDSGTTQSRTARPPAPSLEAEDDDGAMEDAGDAGAEPGASRWSPSGRYLITLDNMGGLDVVFRGWMKEFLLDRELWIRAAGSVLIWGIAWWTLGMAGNAMRSKDIAEAERVMWVALPGFFGAIALIGGVASTMMTCGLVFQQSADRRPRFVEWPGFSPSDWIQPAFFWGLGLWLGSLPGLFAGLILWTTNLGFLSLPFAVFSAMLFGPVLLLCAWYNGSPIQVFSRDVFARFGGKQTAWLKYLPGSVVAMVLFGIGHGISFVPGAIGSFLGAALQTAAVLLFATVSGLYCGLMARKMERGD